MRTLPRLMLASLLALSPLPLLAEDAPSAEPDVTIRQEGDKTIQEYRVNGFLYAVKITSSTASRTSWCAPTAPTTGCVRTSRTC